VICDALDAAALEKAVRLARPEVVVNQLTALPRRINPRRVGRDLAATNRLRREGTRNLIVAAVADAAQLARGLFARTSPPPGEPAPPMAAAS
jgi:hypothetical protein